MKRIFLTIFLLFSIAACSQKEVKQEPPPAPAPVVKEEVPKKVKKTRPLPPVIILVSENIPAYQQVAEELKRILPNRTTVVQLSGSDRAHLQLVQQLKKPEYQQFAAIGLAAAKISRELAGEEDETIFCQVFNYQDYDIVSARAKGVGALPGSAALFARWSKLSPALKSVVVFTGEGLEDVVAVAVSEAAKYGIQLQHRIVASDKEVLFEYKQMAPTIQGLWLLPDNRVLSARTIRELMSFSVRNSKQVAVFSDGLLRLGGLLSVTSSRNEVAAKVAERLNSAYKEKGIPGPELLLLEEGETQVNAVAAKRYNLNYSE